MSIKTSEATDKLWPALLAARKAMTPARKSAENKFDKYRYANEGDWHDAVMAALLDHGLVLQFSPHNLHNIEGRKTQKGNDENAVQVLGVARVTHESGQWAEINCYGEGQDRGDKAVYKALTGMKKYAYALMFALPTTDDAEKDSHIGEDHTTPAKTRTNPNSSKPPEERLKDALAIIAAETDPARLDRLRIKAAQDSTLPTEIVEKIGAAATLRIKHINDAGK